MAAIIFPHTKWLPKITDYRDTAALILRHLVGNWTYLLLVDVGNCKLCILQTFVDFPNAGKLITVQKQRGGGGGGRRKRTCPTFLGSFSQNEDLCVTKNAPYACRNFHSCAFTRFQKPQQLGRRGQHARRSSRHVLSEPGPISAASAVASCG